MSEISRFSRNSSFFNISVVTSKKSQKNISDARDALGSFRFLGPGPIVPECVGQTNEAHAKQLDHQLSSPSRVRPDETLETKKGAKRYQKKLGGHLATHQVAASSISALVLLTFSSLTANPALHVT